VCHGHGNKGSRWGREVTGQTRRLRREGREGRREGAWAVGGRGTNRPRGCGFMKLRDLKNNRQKLCCLLLAGNLFCVMRRRPCTSTRKIRCFVDGSLEKRGGGRRRRPVPRFPRLAARFARSGPSPMCLCWCCRGAR
jgi:hypothetical protein